MFEFIEDSDDEIYHYNLEDYFNVIRDVPIECPECGGGMVLVEREETTLGNMLKLKNRFFHVCKDKTCRFIQNVDDFKKELLSN